MKPPITTTVRFSFTPKLNGPIELTILGDLKVSVDGEQASCTFPKKADPEDLNDVIDGFRARLEALLSSNQIQSFAPFTINESVIEDVDSEGKKSIQISLASQIMVSCSMSADLCTRDKDGNITYSSADAASQQVRRYSALIADHKQDDLLTEALKFHDAATRDSDKELAHLYDIRDALSKKFGGESEAKRALGISGREWSRFGLICNELPLKQGRHSGAHYSNLRDATESERFEARATAKRMLLNYIDWLEK